MHLFSVSDMKEILRIPLSLVVRLDILLWHIDKHGACTIKTVYYVVLGDLNGSVLPNPIANERELGI